MIGSYLKRCRKIRNVTQTELAQWLGVSRQAISMWESGKRELKVTTLNKIAKVFNVTLEELLKMQHQQPDLNKEGKMVRRTTKTKAKTMSNKIKFSLTAPEAGRVALTGDFKAWDGQGIPLKKDRKGNWKGEVKLNPGRYEYKFIVDDQWWLDPNNTQTAQNSFGSLNSVIEVGA